MTIFRPLYAWSLRLCHHPRARGYLGALSFLESSLFPIPTALLLAPMVLAKPQQAWQLALWTTLTSVLGGVFGYLLGYFLFEQIGQALLTFYAAEAEFTRLQTQFNRYGVWLVVLAGVTPIPYKLCTIAAGVMGLALLPFILASLVGRGLQFYIVAGVLWYGGARIEPLLRRYTEWLGWGLLGGALVYFVVVG